MRRSSPGLLARDGNRPGSVRARPQRRGIYQRPVWPGRQDFDRRGHPASRCGASFQLVDAGVVSRPDLSRPFVSHPDIVRGAYRYTHPHGVSDSLGRANRHADTHVIGYANRHADAYTVTQTLPAEAHAHPQAIAHSIGDPERRAVADQVHRASGHRRLT
ncbi:MAG TPA: hypothetical protein VGH53_14400 [Streptosporangiaceae bacterium]